MIIEIITYDVRTTWRRSNCFEHGPAPPTVQSLLRSHRWARESQRDVVYLDRQTDRQAGRQAVVQAGGRAGGQTERRTDGQTNRQTDRKAEREKDREGKHRQGDRILTQYFCILYVFSTYL
jgi:hypothetical protein